MMSMVTDKGITVMLKVNGPIGDVAPSDTVNWKLSAKPLPVFV